MAMVGETQVTCAPSELGCVGGVSGTYEAHAPSPYRVGDTLGFVPNGCSKTFPRVFASRPCLALLHGAEAAPPAANGVCRCVVCGVYAM
jgi:hypothetical protein